MTMPLDLNLVTTAASKDGKTGGPIGLRAGQPLAWGEERVNTYTVNQQQEPEIAVLGDGSYVIVWQSSAQDGASEGVYFQRFAANGMAVGPEQRVNSETAGSQGNPHIAALGNGGFVITWADTSGFDGAGQGIVGQRYSAGGAALGSNFIVNSTTASTQYGDAVAGYASGFAAVWGSTGNAGGNSYDIYLRRFDNDGAQVLAETRISTVVGNPANAQVGQQEYPDIASRSDGSLVIVWQDVSTNDGNGYGVYVRTVSAAGALGDVALVNTFTTGNQYEPRVATLADGGFVVVWRSDGQDGSSAGVYAQRFNAAAVKQGAEFRVNESTPGGQYQPAVTGLATGGFVVTWYNDNYDVVPGVGSTSDVYVRQYDADGVAMEGQRKLASLSNSTESTPVIANLGGGNYVVAYSDYDNGPGGNSTYEVVQQLFGSGPALQRQNPPTLGDFTGSVTFAENLVNATPQVIDASVSLTDTDSADFGGGRLDLYFVQGSEATDQLGVRHQGNAVGQIGVAGNTVSYSGTAIGSFSGGGNGANLVVTFNANASVDAVEALVQNLTYASSSQSPALTRTVAVRVSDGDGGSSVPGLVVINVTPELDGQPVAWAQERVNSYTGGNQDEPEIAVFADGSYLITWQSAGQDGSADGIYFQRFASNGTAFGPEQRVNTVTEGVQSYPHAAVLSSGGFVITWQDNNGSDGSGWGVLGQRFDAAGAPVGNNFVVNTVTTGSQYHDAVAGYSGGFAVVWSAANAGGSSQDIYLARFNDAGTQVLAETRIGSVPGSPGTPQLGNQMVPKIAARSDGSLVVVWQDEQGNDSSSYGVYGRTVAANGTLSDTFLVNTFTTGAQYEPNVALLTGGGFVVVWRSDNQDGSSAGVYAQRFDANAAKVGPEFLVNEGTTGGQYQPAVAGVASGGFVVTWYNDNYDLSGAGTTVDVYIREFDAAGAAIDGQRKLLSPTNSTEASPAIASLGGGNFVVAYADYEPSGNAGNNTYEIAQQLFGSGAALQRQASPTLGDFTGSVTFAENVVNAAPQVIDVSVSLSDADSANFGGGRLDLFFLSGGEASDQLGVRHQGNAAGQIGVAGNVVSFGGVAIGTLAGGANGSNVVVSFNANASVAAVEALVQNLTYATTSQSPGATRSVGLRVSDGDGGSSSTSSVTINVTPSVDGQPLAWGEQQVNTYTASNQQDPEIAVFADGSYVITWQSNGQDGDSEGVYFQRFAPSGTAVGPEQRVNTSTGGVQGYPHAAALSDGSFVITWDDNNGADGVAGWGVLGQRFDAAGVAQGANFVVNNTISNSQYDNAVASYSGGFAVVWADAGVAGNSGFDIFYKRFNNLGDQVLGETRLSTTPGAPGTPQPSTQRTPDVAARADGSLVVVWEDQVGNDSSSYGVYGRLVAANGTLSNTFLVNTFTGNAQYEAGVAVLAGGGFVVVWRSDAQDGSSAGVYGQRFDANAVKVGEEFLVNQTTSGGQYQPAVTGVPSGGFVVTWYNDNYDISGAGSSADVYIREYDAAGAAIDGQRRLPSTTNTPSNPETQPAIASLGNGNFVVAYSDYVPANDGGNATYEITQQVFGSGPALARQADPALGDFTGTVTFAENLVNTTPQVIDVSVSLSDPDSANFAGGRLDLFFVQNGQAADQLGVRHQGNGAGQVGLAGNVVSYGGVSLGTVAGGSNGSNLVISFNAGATVEAVEALVQNLTYASSSQSPAATRTVGLRISDGDGGSSASSTVTINVTPSLDGQPLAWGEERVNTYTAGTQDDPEVAVLADGSYVITWTSNGQDGSGEGVYFQRFAANGVALGSEQRANTATTSAQNYPHAAALSDGGFVLVWQDNGGVDGSGYGVIGQRYNAAGVAQNANFVVNTFTSSTQYHGVVAGYTGGFAVAWASQTNAGGAGLDVYYRRFNNDGSQAFAETRVSTIPGSPASAQLGNQVLPAIAARADGSLVVVWEEQNGSDGSSYGIYGRTVAANGTLSDTFLVNTYTNSTQWEPSVAVLSGGGFVVVWRSEGQDGSSAGVYGQRFDANAVKVGSEFQVNETTTNGQYQPAVTGVPSGGFVVTWYNDNYDLSGTGSTADVYIREYDASGAAIDGQRRLPSNTNTPSNPENQPAIASLGNGNFVVAYADYVPANDGGNATYEISQQIFGSGPSLNRGANPHLGDLSALRTLSSTVASPLYAGLALPIDADVSLTDADSANFDGGQLTVAFVSGGAATDALAVRNQGTAAGQISVAGADVSFGGTLIGSFSGGGAGGATLVVTLNASATAAAVRALVENITYQSSAPPAGTTDRYVSFRLTDGDGGASLPDVVQIRIQASVTPVAVALDDVRDALNISETQANAGVLVDDAVQLVYSGAGSFNGGRLTVSYLSSSARPDDQLAIRNEGNGPNQVGVTGSAVSLGGVAVGTVSATLTGVNGTTLEITFNAAATDQAVERVIENLRYSNSSAAPNAERTIRIVVTDSASVASTARDIDIGISAQTDPTAGVPLTLDRQANSYEGGQQQASAVARLFGPNDGGYVIAWQSQDGQDGSGYSVQAQRFDANGAAQGAEISVNTYTLGNQYQAAVGGLASGGFVVAWRSDAQDGSSSGIYAQRYDADGQTAGGEFRVNTSTLSTQDEPAVLGLADGSFVVIYSSVYVGSNATYDVLGQRYSAGGAPLGGEFVVNTNLTSAQSQPQLSTLTTGGFVAVWTDSSGADGSGNGVIAQRFAADGSKVGGEIVVNTTTGGSQLGGDVAALPGGAFVVAWEYNNTIYAQRFDAAGGKVGPELVVSTPDATANYNNYARVAALGNGGFVVTWDNNGSLGGSGYDVLAQQYNAAGQRVDGVFVINSNLTNTQIESDVAGLAGNNFVFSWSGYNQERDTASTYGIFHRVFGTAGSVSVSAAPVLVDVAPSVTLAENLINVTPQLLDASVGLSDADSDNFDGGRLWVSVISSYPDNTDQQLSQDLRTQDQLGLRSVGNGPGQVAVAGANVSYGGVVVGSIVINGANGADLVLLFNSNATSTAVEAVIESLTYANSSSSPGASRTVSISVSDGDGASSVPRLVEVNVTPEADGPQPLFGNEVVNTYRSDTQDEAAGAGLADGGYVIVWASEGQDGSSTGIQGQRFTAAGERIGPEFEINSQTLNQQTNPSVAGLTGGGYVVTWQSQAQDGSGWGVYGQRFDAAGIPAGAEFRANTITANSQYQPAITATIDGGYVIAWYHDNASLAGTEYYDVFFQRYNAAGVAQGVETRANPVTGLATSSVQSEPTLAALTGGGFVTLWTDSSNPPADGSGNGYGVYGQVFNAGGTAVGASFRVNTYTADNQYTPDAVGLAGGGFVAVWRSDNQDGSSAGVFGQRFDAAGNKVGVEFRVNNDISGNEYEPSVAALTGGGFAVTWNDDSRTFVQQFAADGTRVDGELRVDTIDGNNNANQPSAFGLTGGGFVVAWRDYDYSGSTYDVYQQVFGNPAVVTRQIAPVISDQASSVTFNENLVNATPQLLDGSVDVSDADSPNFAGGRLWVSVISGYGDISYAQLPELIRAQDQLGIRNIGNGAGQVGVSGNTVSVGGVPVATIESTGSNGNDLVLLFNAAATEGLVELVVEALTYANTSSAPVASRTLSISVSDGDGGTSAPRVVTVNITPQADGAQALFDNEVVNTFHPDTQSQAAVARLTDGGYVIAWAAAGQDGWASAVRAQRFDSNGVAVGSEFQANTYTPYDQDQPSVTGLSNGGFVIGWESANQDGSGTGIFAQMFSANGLPLGTEILVNSGTASAQNYVDMAALPGGGFIATWGSTTQNGTNYDIYAQRFDGAGAKVGPEFRANTSTGVLTGYQWEPAVAAAADGSFVIVWRSDSQDGDGTGVFGQRFNAAGAPLGAEFQANTYTNGNQYQPDVAVLTGGGFVVVWRSDAQDGTNAGVFGQRYNAAGSAVGAEFRVNTDTAGDENQPSVTALSHGGFAVTYYDSARIRVQQFAADGTRLDNETLVDTNDNNANGSVPAVAGLDNGGFVVTFTDYDYSIGSYEVYQQFFGNPALVVRQANPDLVDVTPSITFAENLVNAVPQLIDSGVGLSDIDSPNFDGGLLEVNYLTGYGAQDQLGLQSLGNQDQLGIRSVGNAIGQVSVAGAVVSYSGVAIGNIVGNGANGGRLSVQFNASATVEAVEHVIESLTYANTVSNPIASRTVSIRVSDGDGGSSEARSVTINVTPQTDGAVPFGLERTVNTTVASQQYEPDVARLADGGYVVVWEDNGALDGSSYSVQGQRYDANDNAVGSQFRANTFTTGAQYEAQVTGLNGGGFVVVWRSDNQDGSGTGVYGRLYDSAGAPASAEFRVNATIASNQYQPAITATADGGFVVGWYSDGSIAGSSSDVYFQRYNAAAVVQGVETRANPSSNVAQSEPALAGLTGGGFVMTWTDGNADGSSNGVFAQRFSNLGAPLGSSFQVNSYTDNQQTESSIAALNDGGFIVVWQSLGEDLSGWGIYAQRYTAVGAPVGAEFRVNTTISSNQYDSTDVAALANGGFVVTWYSDNTGDVYLQQYNAAGSAVDGETRGNTYTYNMQYQPAVAGTPDGGFVLVWSGFIASGDGNGDGAPDGGNDTQEIRLQRFNNTAPNVSDVSVNGLEEAVIVLTNTLFESGFVDPDGQSLQAIKIILLPDNGTLRLAGNLVLPNQEIQLAELQAGLLTYQGDLDFFGLDQFRWTGSDGITFAATPVFTNVNLSNVNDGPRLEAGADDTASEGTFFGHNIVLNDPDPEGHRITVTWGDGSTPSVYNVGNTPNHQISHVYADNGVYTVSVTADDQRGQPNSVETDGFVVTVANVAPTIGLGGANNVEQGQPYTLTLGSVNDPGADTVSEYRIDWGDGTALQIILAANLPANGQVLHTYAVTGPRTIGVTLVDEDGVFTNAGTRNITVSAPAEVITVDAGLDVQVFEGTNFNKLISFTDPNDQLPAGRSYSVAWGDGQTSNGFVPAGVFSFNINHQYPDHGQTYSVVVTVDDSGAQQGSDTFLATVQNVAPIVNLGGAGSTNEGSNYVLTLSAVDPGADTISQYSIDWGDGSAVQVVLAANLPGNGQVTHLYADGQAPVVINVAVVDEDGSWPNAGTKNVFVNNVAPTAPVTGNDTVAEGSVYTLNVGLVSDPGLDTRTGYSINWGDGNTSTFTVAQWDAAGGAFQHTYADGDNGGTGRSIVVSTTDEDGTFTLGTKTLTVNNAAPTVLLTGAAATNEGASYVLNISATDPAGAADTLSYSINWGDGSALQNLTALQLAALSGNVAHTFGDDEDGPVNSTVRNIGVTVNDGEGGVTVEPKAVAVNNVAPTAPVTGNDTVAEASVYTLNVGLVVEPGVDTRTGYSINWGDGNTSNFTPAQWDAAAGVFTHTYADGGNGGTARSIVVSTTDEDGSFTLGSKNITVGNAAPAVLLTGAAATNEGASYVLSIAGSDPAGAADPLSYSINWGDGTALQVLSAAQLAALSGNVPHVFADDEDGPVNATARNVSVTVSDDDGGSSTQNKTVTVNNVAPTIGLAGAATVPVGQTYTLTLGAVTDPGQDTVSSYLINWGDGSAVQTVASNGNVTHTYSSTGAQNIQVSLVDEDGTYNNVAALQVTVQAATPTLTLEAGAGTIINEGSTFSRNINFSDGQDNGAAGWTYSIDYGDGSPVVTGSTLVQSLALSHVYADGNSSSNVTVTVTDEPGESASDGFNVQVNNVAPTAVVTGADTVAEGSVYTLAVSAVADPGADTRSSYSIAWGDAIISSFTAAEWLAAGGSFTHTYADGAAAQNIVVTTTDEDGTFVLGSKAVSVTNVAPTMVLTGNNSSNEGDPYNLVIAGSDPAGGNDPLTYTVDWGDGSPVQAVSAGLVSHTFADDEDGPVNSTPRTITVTANDGDGGISVETKVVAINNVAPTAAVSGANAVVEGSPYALNVAAVVEPGADTRSAYSIDWGDGNTSSFTPAQWGAALGVFNHTYADGGNGGTVRNIVVSTTDEDGTFTLGSKALTVNNAAPAVVLTGAAATNEGASYVLNIAGSDPAGAADPLSYSINWGDGTAVQVLSAAQLAALSGNVAHTFADDEDGPVNATPRNITVTVSDDDGGSSTQNKTVTVNNVAPTIALGGAGTATVGQLYTLNLGTVTDPGQDTVSSYLINWGDGSAVQTVASNGNVTHTYGSTGPQTVQVSLVDEDGTFNNVASLQLTVQAATPNLSLEAGADAALNEGQTFSRSINFSDGQDNGAPGWTYSINYGDGSAVVTGSTLVQSLALSHVYADGNSSANVTVTVTDEPGESASDGFVVTVNNLAPTAAVTGNDTVAEGSAYTLNVGVVVEPGVDTRTGYTINWGDGNSSTFTPAQWTSAAGVFNHTYADGGNGGTPRSIVVSSTDEDGTFTLGSKNITVNNAAPAVVLGGAAATNEGASYLLNITGSDPAGAADPLSYSIDWGDGTALQTLTAAELALLSGNVAHVYADDQDGPVNATPRSISVTVNDGDGGSSAQGKVVTVNNVAPTIALGGAATATVGSAYTLNLGAVADPGQDTVSSYVIDWGDGSPVQAVASNGNVTHTYASPGPRTVAVDLVDEDGTFNDVATLQLNVLNNQPPELITIGNAPARLTLLNPTAWVTAWTHPTVAITHKADADDTAAAWTPVTFSNANPNVLSGGDISLGDLGVSGQSAATSVVRQEMDGAEGLRFALQRDATSATIDFSSLVRNDDALAYAEAGRIQAFDAAGVLVAEQVFAAINSNGLMEVTISAAAGFRSLVVTSGAYDAGTFVDGAYAALTGGFGSAPFISGGKLHGSEFMVHAVEFELEPVPPQVLAGVVTDDLRTTMQVQPGDML